jgi:hypothetical protein
MYGWWSVFPDLTAWRSAVSQASTSALVGGADSALQTEWEVTNIYSVDNTA